MVSAHCQEHACDLSDDEVVWGRTENPCWQYLTGMKRFEHEMPVNPSGMTRWRKRIGEGGAQELLNPGSGTAAEGGHALAAQARQRR